MPYQNDMEVNKIYNTDCLIGLKGLPNNSIDCCVTSPPYYGLRDYGTGQWIGGDTICDHKGKPFATKAYINKNCGTGNDVKNALDAEPFKGICLKCGAKRIDSQIGLEETPELYVQKMVDVFSEVKRVLKKEGTLWLNLGDSYNGYPGNVTQGGKLSGQNQHARQNKPSGYGLSDKSLKPKDLIGIPWLVAFSLRADGWYLRQDIIWYKRNPMPESVTDRCTKSHEYIFLMSKSKKYYYDAESIAEETLTYDDGYRDRDSTKLNNTPGRTKMDGLKHNKYEKRNKRSVWDVTTKPYKESHFATFPEDLISDCIKAGCPEGGVVLDCFMGAGTTAVVARKLNRNYVGFELNPQYVKMAEDRVIKEVGLFL